jgi:Zn-dependent alcohol dehydrogenase
MKAAVCRAFGEPLAIEEVDLAPPGPGEIRVKVAACAICHSDIHYAEGAWGGDLPAVYGHEAAGLVEETGSGVTAFQPGDHVVVTLIRSCGHCHYCTQGKLVSCETTFPLDENSPLSADDGSPVVHGLRTGTFAEYAVVDESQAVAIPKDMPLDSASLLACGVITGLGAVVNTAAMRPGANVVVIGAGGVGLNSVQGAAIAGARTIVAVDIVESKLEAAMQFGATHAIDGRADDAHRQVRKLTDGRGADYVFVTVGAKAAFDQAFKFLAFTGALVVVGMPPSDVTATYQPEAFAFKSQRILGSKMGSSRIRTDIPWLVSLYQQGRLKLDELVTGRYPLDQINEAIASTKSGEALRNVITFD